MYIVKMKKVYVKPSMKSVTLFMDPLMQATSIENASGDVQTGIKEDDRDDFEAGSKKNNSSWNLWDE